MFYSGNTDTRNKHTQIKVVQRGEESQKQQRGKTSKRRNGQIRRGEEGGEGRSPEIPTQKHCEQQQPDEEETSESL